MTEKEFETLMDATLRDFARAISAKSYMDRKPITKREIDCFHVAALLFVDKLFDRLVVSERSERR